MEKTAWGQPRAEGIARATLGFYSESLQPSNESRLRERSGLSDG